MFVQNGQYFYFLYRIEKIRTTDQAREIQCGCATTLNIQITEGHK